jgi:hypothetical protein
MHFMSSRCCECHNPMSRQIRVQIRANLDVSTLETFTGVSGADEDKGLSHPLQSKRCET